MKLYTAKISPFAAMCRIQIYFKGLDVELLALPDDASWEDIAAISPIKKIPVLVDGASVILESAVVAEYLEDKHPEPSLKPATAAERAQMRLLSRIADLYVMTPLTVLFAHLSRKHRNQAVVDAELKNIEKGLSSLEQFIDRSGFAVGSQLTLADCSLVPIFVFIEKYLPFFAIDKPLDDYPKLLAYWQKITTEPVIEKVIAEIQQGIAAKAGKK